MAQRRACFGALACRPFAVNHSLVDKAGPRCDGRQCIAQTAFCIFVETALFLRHCYDDRRGADDRVVVVEGENARELSAERLAELSGSPEQPTLIVVDVSFISLTTVLPALAASLPADADLVVLVKPQFEVGRGGAREGIVRDRAARLEAVSTVLWAAWDLGLGTAGVISSPVLGSNGNQEYLAWLQRECGSNPTEWGRAIDALA